MGTIFSKLTTSIYVNYITFREVMGPETDQEWEAGLPGGSLVKNPPANAGDTGSIPDPGRSHMPWSNWACAQLLSPCTATTDTQVPGARDPQQERSLRWQAHTPQWRVAPTRCNQRQPTCSKEGPAQPKIINPSIRGRGSRWIKSRETQPGLFQRSKLWGWEGELFCNSD